MRCLICDHPADTFYDEKLKVETYHCQQCACIFKSHETHQALAAQKSRYDLHENNPEDAGYRAYFQRFLDVVLTLVSTPRNALDFGCGRSRLLSEMLIEQGVVCDAYDPIYHPDMEYHTNKYDLIVSTEVFEHLHDPKMVFEALLDRLNAGGYLAIQTQFHGSTVEGYRTWYYRQDPTHIVFFTPQTFRVLCGRFGCTYVGDNGKNILVLRKD